MCRIEAPALWNVVFPTVKDSIKRNFPGFKIEDYKNKILEELRTWDNPRIRRRPIPDQD